MKKITLLLLLCACTTNTYSTFNSTSSKNEIFNASTRTVQEMGFAVLTSNKSDGFISAGQSVVLGEGSQTIINIQVHNNKNIEVSIIPPPLTLGNIASMMNEFENKMRNKVSGFKIIK